MKAVMDWMTAGGFCEAAPTPPSAECLKMSRGALLLGLGLCATSRARDFRVSVDGGAGVPDDPDYTNGGQWDLRDVDLPPVWQQGEYGNKEVAGVHDRHRVGPAQPRPAAQPLGEPRGEGGPGATAGNGYRNGIDDDGNGIIDDVYGANFVDGSTNGNCQDQNGHGSFVAGVVGAVGNNGLGVTGVDQVALHHHLPLHDASGNGWISDAIRCVQYCVSQGAHVLSNSWGGVDYSLSLQAAINNATSRGGPVRGLRRE